MVKHAYLHIKIARSRKRLEGHPPLLELRVRPSPGPLGCAPWAASAGGAARAAAAGADVVRRIPPGWEGCPPRTGAADGGGAGR